MSFIFSFWNTKHFCFHLQPAEPPARHNPVDVQTPDGAPVVVDADVRIGAAAEVRPGPALAVALEEEITFQKVLMKYDQLMIWKHNRSAILLYPCCVCPCIFFSGFM